MSAALQPTLVGETIVARPMTRADVEPLYAVGFTFVACGGEAGGDGGAHGGQRRWRGLGARPAHA